jgi:phosphatidylglycerophosphatase C
VSDTSAGAGRVVAAFDFDGTLTRRDSLLPFLARVVGWPRTAFAMARVFPQLVLAQIGKADRDAAKERLLVRLLAGRSYDEVARVGAAYAGDLVARAIRPEMRDLVAWHRAQGHDVVIVSASLDVYLHQVGTLLDVQSVLSTQLAVDAHGACTGGMLGGNCRGPGKADRLRAYLGDEPVELWAYGDSAGDAEMLAMADHTHRARHGRLVANPR